VFREGLVSEHFDYDLLCIGSGPAGQGAAIQAAKLGRRVALVEKRRGLGGVGVETGIIPSKTFREAVLFFTRLGGPLDRRNAPRPEDRPTARELLRRVDDVLLREAQIVERQLRGNGVEILAGEASFSSPHTMGVRSANGNRREITAESILLAVGTTAIPPLGVPKQSDSVITCDQVMQLTQLPQTMIVVGAGLVGIEYASMFAALGIEVALFDKLSRPLGFLDVELVSELMDRLRERGVSFHLGEEVRQVEVKAPRVALVHLSRDRRFVADLVLFAIGRTGSTRELNLSAAGLEPDSRGRLEVDEAFRTRVDHIFAVGDVVGHLTLAATASEQGRRAACVACGAPEQILGARYPIGIYSIPEISTFGATELELARSRVPYEVGVARYRDNTKGQILGENDGFLKLLFHGQTGKLIGVHIIGANATELIHIGQAVMQLGGTYDYFLHTVFNHPTLAECYRSAAQHAATKFR
jgi:NAD(P) transhydrogenase